MLYKTSVFFPKSLVEMLADPLGVRPACRELFGSAMFCDVAGFTPLTEALSVLGKEGAEELTRLLNGYFTRMIEIIERRGGDVLRFGGDAMTVFFAGDWHENTLVTAKEMMAVMPEFSSLETRAGAFGISMKIGISTGSIRLGIVGDDDVGWDYYAEGKPLDDSAEAEHHASPGQIVCHGSFVESSHVRCGEFLNGGFMRIEGPFDPPESVSGNIIDITGQPEISDTEVNVLEENMRRFIPSYLAERAGENVVGEHRGTAVVFLSFHLHGGSGGGIGEGERHRALCDIYLKYARTAGKYGGIVNKLDMGDKGAKAIFLFGSPFAIERKEEMAVRLALELLGGDSAAEKVPYKIGITTSALFSGPVGSKSRREFTVMGDGINMAARLMAASEPGKILVSAPVAELSEDKIEYLRLDPIRVKGKREAVEILQPVGEIDGGGTTVRNLIERDDICKEISRFLLKGGKPVAIVGPPGSGKTALIGWAFKEARVAGIEASREQLVPYRIDQPFSAWKSAIRGVLGISAKDPADKKVRARDAALAGELPGYRPLLNPFLDLDEEVTPALRNLSPKERKDLTFAIASRLLESAGERVIIVDDLHWGDPLSLEFMTYLARESTASELRLIASLRDDTEGLETVLEGMESLKVIPLTEGGISRFLVEQHGMAPPQKEVLSWFYARCRGIPSIISAMVTALKAANLLYEDRSGLQVDRDRLFVTEFPETLEGLYLARVDRLQTIERAVLQMASILGSSVSVNLLRQICQTGEEELDTALSGLVHAGLLQPDTWGLRSYFRFSDSMLRDAVYGALPFVVKRDGHLKIASFLEPDGREKHKLWPVLAHHFECGGNDSRAREYHRLAGRAALKRSDNVTALKHLEYACASITADSADVEDAFNLLDVYAFLGRWNNSKPILDRLLGVSAQMVGVNLARLQFYLATDHCRCGRMEEAEERLLDGLSRYQGMKDISGIGKSYVNLVGIVYGPTGQLEKARHCLEKALELPKGPGQSSWRAMSAMNLGSILWLQGVEKTKVAECFRTAYQEAVNGKLGSARATIASNMSGLYYEMGDFEKAVYWGKRAIELLEKSSARLFLLHAQHNFALSQFASGRASEMMDLLAEVERQVESRRYAAISGDAERCFLIAHWMCGDVKGALRYAELAAMKYSACGNNRGMVDTLAWVTGIFFSLDAREEAKIWWDRCNGARIAEESAGDASLTSPLERVSSWISGSKAEDLEKVVGDEKQLSPDEDLERVLWTVEDEVDGRGGVLTEDNLKSLMNAMRLWPSFMARIRYYRIMARSEKGLDEEGKSSALRLLSRCIAGTWGLRLMCLIWKNEGHHKKADFIRYRAIKELYRFYLKSPGWAWEKIKAFPEVRELLKG